MNDEERNQTFLSGLPASRTRKRNHPNYQSSEMSLEQNPITAFVPNLPVDNPGCSSAKKVRLARDVNLDMPPQGLRIDRRVVPCPYYSPPISYLNTRYFPVFDFGGFNEGRAPEAPIPLPIPVPSPMQLEDTSDDEPMLPGGSSDGRNTDREDNCMLSRSNEEDNFREWEERYARRCTENRPSQLSSVDHFTNPRGRHRLSVRIFVKLPEVPNISMGENNEPDHKASGDFAMEID